MSKSQRDKGARVEREIVHRHLDIGVPAERVPLSGAAGGSCTGDVWLSVTPDARWTGEVKARKDGAGFATLERWLGDNDVLFLRRNNSEPMVVLPWRSWVRLVGRGE